MREILFRGQIRKKGEKVRLDGTPIDSNWVYGGVLQGKGDFSIIYQTEPKIEKFSVYSDTLGQYTGLTDKNGTKIFEGDIVLFNVDERGVVYYDNEETSFMMEYGNCIVLMGYCYCSRDLEVIGNIHDNPELLEQEADNGC